MNERWRLIPGYGENYEASSFGRIRSKDREVEKFSAVAGKVVKQHYKGKVLSPCKGDKYGHLVVHLGVNRQRFNVHIARLVLLAFKGEPQDGEQACHNDGDPSNNRPDNLRWGTQAENNRDRLEHGRYLHGEAHRMVKIGKRDVVAIRESNETGIALAKKYGISTTQVSRIKNGRSWGHV